MRVFIEFFLKKKEKEKSRHLHYKDTFIKEIGLCLEICINYSTFISELNWEDLCIRTRN